MHIEYATDMLYNFHLSNEIINGRDDSVTLSMIVSKSFSSQEAIYLNVKQRNKVSDSFGKVGN